MAAVILQQVEIGYSGSEVMRTAEERLAMHEIGKKFYESLRPGLEPKYFGKRIAISIKTGRYVLADSDAEFATFAATLEFDDMMWIGSVDNP